METHLLQFTLEELEAAIDKAVDRVNAEQLHLTDLYIAYGARRALEGMGFVLSEAEA